MKPFIHLFKTPQNYYLYDVNTNSKIKVTEKLFYYLDHIIKDKEVLINNDEVENEIHYMKERGLLSAKRPRVLSNTLADSSQLMLERNLQMCVLQMTQSCNLRCLYCPYTANNGSNRLHSSKSMTWETAKRSIDFYKSKSVDSDIAILSFYGGEPLINFDLMKKCVHYFESVFEGKEHKYYVTTNGTLLDGEIIYFLEEKKFSVTLSLDGPKVCNDKNRKFHNDDKSVFDIVCNNLRKLIAQNSSLISNMAINMVVDPSIPFKMYAELYQNEPIFSKVNVKLSILDDSGLETKTKINDLFIQEYYYYDFLSLLNVLGRYKFLNEMPLIYGMYSNNINALKELPKMAFIGDADAPSGPCIPGYKRVFVDVDGFLYPCEKISETKENVIGDIYNGFNFKAVVEMLNYTSEDSCKDCFAFRNCTLCKKVKENLSQEDKKSLCDSVRLNFHNKLCLNTILEELRFNKISY